MFRTILSRLLPLCLLAALGCNFPSAIRTAALPQETATLELAEVVEPATLTPTTIVVPTVTPTYDVFGPPRPVPTLVQVALKPSVTATSLPAPTRFVEPAGCQRPPDDYTRLIVNGAKLNRRTFWMLQRAQQLYGGVLNFTGFGITQGSYNPGGVAASFGTHDGGGAVDLSVLNPRTGQIMRDDFPKAIHALRVAGFAAWVREPNELYNGSPIHIHAIAIGDAELSPAAKDQLTGTFGYFLGYNGLPKTDNIPVPDRHGGPILCQWMIDMGYKDLRR